MQKIAPEEIRRKRADVLRPIIEYLDAKGIRYAWLAREIGSTSPRLWNYFHGINEPPDWFIPAACNALGIPLTFVTRGKPLNELFPPKKHHPAATIRYLPPMMKTKTSKNGASDNGSSGSNGNTEDRRSHYLDDAPTTPALRRTRTPRSSSGSPGNISDDAAARAAAPAPDGGD